MDTISIKKLNLGLQGDYSLCPKMIEVDNYLGE